MRYRQLRNKVRILIVNDDRLIQKSLYELLCRHGYTVDLANSISEALIYLHKNLYQVVLADTNAANSHNLLKVVKQRRYLSETIILTSYGNIEAAVNCIKMGAFDYLVRPIEDKKIISTIERILASKLPAKTAPLSLKRLSNHKEEGYYGLIGNSLKSKKIYSLIETISNSKATVLLHGESGTGKRMIARVVHKADKKRRTKPFIEISCGALPREIIESELFGHTRGSFTDAISDRIGRFELAHRGTILLDDIDCLPLDLQVKLLRVLQQREFERIGDHKTIKVDVRIIATTNQDLEKAVAQKRFREDLYYRLNVVSIEIPPIRQRKEDLPPLIRHYVDIYARENNKKVEEVSEDALHALINYDWPGNIRQLQNIIERAVILDTDSIIDKKDLPEIILSKTELIDIEVSPDKKADAYLSLKEALKEPEKIYILKVLKEVGWNKKKAARKLGVNRTTLYNKLHKYNILASE